LFRYREVGNVIRSWLIFVPDGTQCCKLRATVPSSGALKGLEEAWSVLIHALDDLDYMLAAEDTDGAGETDSATHSRDSAPAQRAETATPARRIA
jgi:hypothetical protein